MKHNKAAIIALLLGQTSCIKRHIRGDEAFTLLYLNDEPDLIGHQQMEFEDSAVKHLPDSRDHTAKSNGMWTGNLKYPKLLTPDMEP